jgi:uncharacterized damage-inducible protein DinB
VATCHVSQEEEAVFIDGLRTFYVYGDWAIQRLLDASADLTQEQWLREGIAGQGSVRDTLVHMISAQRYWLAFWGGSLAPDQPLDPARFPDVEAVRAAWIELESATERFLAGLEETDLEREYSRPSPEGRVHVHKLWQMIMHVANHGTQHRSEVAAMLTSYGHSPGDLDFSAYLRSLADAAGLPTRPRTL